MKDKKIIISCSISIAVLVCVVIGISVISKSPGEKLYNVLIKEHPEYTRLKPMHIEKMDVYNVPGFQKHLFIEIASLKHHGINMLMGPKTISFSDVGGLCIKYTNFNLTLWTGNRECVIPWGEYAHVFILAKKMLNKRYVRVLMTQIDSLKYIFNESYFKDAMAFDIKDLKNTSNLYADKARYVAHNIILCTMRAYDDGLKNKAFFVSRNEDNIYILYKPIYKGIVYRIFAFKKDGTPAWSMCYAYNKSYSKETEKKALAILKNILKENKFCNSNESESSFVDM